MRLHQNKAIRAMVAASVVAATYGCAQARQLQHACETATFVILNASDDDVVVSIDDRTVFSGRERVVDDQTGIAASFNYCLSDRDVIGLFINSMRSDEYIIRGSGIRFVYLNVSAAPHITVSSDDILLLD